MSKPSAYPEGRYVYVHVLDGEVIYVGAGTGRRGWDFATRSEQWKHTVGSRTPEVAVYTSGLDNDGARDCEIDLIRELRPVANINHNPDKCASSGREMVAMAVWVPAAWDEALKAMAAARGMSKGALHRQILAAALELEPVGTLKKGRPIEVKEVNDE